VPDGYARYAGIGLQYAATIGVLGALGYWADQSFGATPWLMIVGIILGSVGGFVSIIKKVPGSSPRSARRKETADPGPRDTQAGPPDAP
jgi:F0F1-type ATP synthase assembly protein I